MKSLEATLPLFDACIEDIDAAYKRLGHTLGWRFLSVSRAVLDNPVKIALVTINPAGNAIPSDHPWQSCENGSSYIVEKWGNSTPGRSTLQVQVQEMFRLLRDTIGFSGSHEELLAQSLISHFVPFRSPRFDDLPRKAESVEVGRKLWSNILPRSLPRLVICLGRDVQKELRWLIPQSLSATHIGCRSHLTGWGNYTADVDSYMTPHGSVRLLFLPHLSTWTLFTSGKSLPHMPTILRDAAHDL